MEVEGSCGDTIGGPHASGGDEGGEGLVKEIERSMFETLVHETFTVMVGGVDTKGKC